MIKKFNFKTPGREDDDAETKLYTKADVNARKEGNQTTSNEAHMDPVSALITKGLGGKANISDVDCCATRLRITVEDAGKVNEDILKQSGSRGIVKKGQGVQIIYGPQVTVIKANLEDYLETADDSLEETEEVIERPSSEENAVTEKTVQRRRKSDRDNHHIKSDYRESGGSSRDTGRRICRKDDGRRCRCDPDRGRNHGAGRWCGCICI